MKTRINICIALLAALALNIACVNNENVDFGIDTQEVNIGADGGVHAIKISSPDNWIAMTDDPWISVSPANGRGSVECQVKIDSALTTQPRKGRVRIHNQATFSDLTIEINQDGYQNVVEIEKNEVTVPNYAAYDNRFFDVNIQTNVAFDIEVPDDAGWLSFETPKFNFNRGKRPREVVVRFNWQISSQPERIAQVKFIPREEEAARVDGLKVTQQAAPAIEENTRAGDSVSLLGIARALDTWYSWESAEPMDNWDSVVLWEEGMEGWTPEKDGRVKSADFFLFATREGLPYEVQYLTAAEELIFRSNVNSFLYDLDTGDHISKLTQLKRLTIDAYGLTTLPESFINLQNLEYLSLASNNFEVFPSILRKENFPNLKAVIMNANQRDLIYDMSNASLNKIGGFYSSSGPDAQFPRWLLEWDTLEQLILSVNYLQGTLPTLDDDPSWTEFYTEEDVMAADSLPKGQFPQGIVGLPKVWPKMRRLGINLNRLTGSLPDWLLYHPALDWWIPFTFVFTQEGKDETGRNAGFDNEPSTTMDYYYSFYTTKNNPYDGESKTDSDDETSDEEQNNAKRK